MVGVDGREVGDEIHATLALLLLELEGDVAHGALLDLHRELGNLVSHPSTISRSNLLWTPLTTTTMDNNHPRCYSLPYLTSQLYTNLNSLEKLHASFLIHNFPNRCKWLSY